MGKDTIEHLDLLQRSNDEYRLVAIPLDEVNGFDAEAGTLMGLSFRLKQTSIPLAIIKQGTQGDDESCTFIPLTCDISPGAFGEVMEDGE